MRRLTQNPRSTARRGFTLIELMIVVVVIGILISLVLPAVTGSIGRARDNQVRAEITGLEAAIANFKSTFGVEPPSRIRLYEQGSGSPSWSSHSGTFTEPVTGTMLSHDAERVRSVALINRIWPNFDFTLARDLNGDGATTGFISLTGPECLVFFLGGGVVASPGGSFAVTGFSKNPANPLAAAAGNESREGPFFEFVPSRLKLSLNLTNLGALVYVDPRSSQSMPYVYASSYDGRGYQLADLYTNSADDLNDVYRSANVAPFIAQKPKSFQIISAGSDGLYGSGGFFSPSAPSHGLTNSKDYDNITNFHQLKLSE